MTDTPTSPEIDYVPTCAEAKTAGCYVAPWIVDLEAAIGQEALCSFLMASGGMELKIPKRAMKGRAVSGLLDHPEITEWLIDHFQGQVLFVPLATTSLRIRRRAMIFRMKSEQHTNAEIATATQCSIRSVQYAITSMRAQGLLSD